MNNKHILFLTPPNPFLINPLSVPRLGVLYLATALKQHGHEVTVCHLQTFSELEELVKLPFDVIGVSATTREYLDALQILNYFKREHHPATVIIGGPHATALPDECLRNGFDLVVTGEADGQIIDILDNPIKRGTIVHAGFVQNLNCLPFPNRRLVNSLNTQAFMGMRQPSLRTTTMMLSRGCPYRCEFCGPHFAYRRRSKEHIVSELRMLANDGYEGLIILDDLPFVNKEQAYRFCETIQPFNFRFRCNLRTDFLTPKIAMRLADAGCCRLQFGIESASQLVLQRINKGDTTHNGEAIKLCRETGIEAKAMFIFGLPGDNLISAQKIVEWVACYRPDSIQVSKFTPLPGSPLWQNGYHFTDYTTLSFFPNSFFTYPLTHQQDQVSEMIYWILLQCQEFTHIDSGATMQNHSASTKK